MLDRTGVQGRKKRVHFTRKQKIIVGLVLAGIIILWFAWREISAPVSGTMVVSKDTLRQQPEHTASTTSSTEIQNQYFQVSLPAGYRAQAANDSVQGLLYQQTIIKPSTAGSIVINIAVKRLPEGGLTNDSSYKLRAKNPSRYEISQQTVNGQNVVMSDDKQAGSVVAFLAQGSYMATVSASSGVGNPSSQDLAAQKRALQPVLEAWRWQ